MAPTASTVEGDATQPSRTRGTFSSDARSFTCVHSRRTAGVALGNRRAGIRPGALGLDLRGEREQGRLVAGATDDLDRERHALGREAEGDRHRRVAEVVPGDAVGI